MAATTRTQTEIACESCETVYVVALEPSGCIDPDVAPPRCEDCGGGEFRTLDTDGGGRSYSAP